MDSTLTEAPEVTVVCITYKHEEYIAQATAYEVVEETDKRGETTGRLRSRPRCSHLPTGSPARK